MEKVRAASALPRTRRAAACCDYLALLSDGRLAVWEVKDVKDPHHADTARKAPELFNWTAVMNAQVTEPNHGELVPRRSGCPAVISGIVAPLMTGSWYQHTGVGYVPPTPDASSNPTSGWERLVPRRSTAGNCDCQRSH